MHTLGPVSCVFLCVLGLAPLVPAAPPAAETPEKPSHSEAPSSIVPKALPYKTERWEEDYTYLRDPGARTEWLDSLKYIPLNDKGDWYLTLAGQARYRYEF